jgi:hypothetical protein
MEIPTVFVPQRAWKVMFGVFASNSVPALAVYITKKTTAGICRHCSATTQLMKTIKN